MNGRLSVSLGLATTKTTFFKKHGFCTFFSYVVTVYSPNRHVKFQCAVEIGCKSDTSTAGEIIVS